MATSHGWLIGSTALRWLRLCNSGLLQLILWNGIQQIYMYYIWEDCIIAVQDFRHSWPSFVRQDRQWVAVCQWLFQDGREWNWAPVNHTLMATGKWWDWKTKSQYPELQHIAQVEDHNWRSEIDDFLMLYMYRSTPQSTTGSSIRTKLPQLQEFTVEDEVRDRDSERKEKGKVYADSKSNMHLQLFRRMVIVSLLSPMVYTCSTVEMFSLLYLPWNPPNLC